MKKHFLSIFLCMCFFPLPLAAQEATVKQLPPPQTDIGKPLMQVLKLRQSTRSFDTKALPAQELSNLLWAANGFNRPEAGKRTAPSAMNMQEIDIYVVLEDGAYIFDAKKNELHSVISKDIRAAAGTQPFVKDAPLNLIYVADYAKITRGSNDDKILYTGADAGFIAQNVYLYCASQGLGAVVRASADRAALAKELQLRPEQKIILAQTVGYVK
jgi:SagB-type dehydrogenase family enzyme